MTNPAKPHTCTGCPPEGPTACLHATWHAEIDRQHAAAVSVVETTLNVDALVMARQLLGTSATEQDAELTAEEARALVDQLSTDLYQAQDALAFVEECCVIADRAGRDITTADVREWMKGARCGRQLAAVAAGGPQPTTTAERAAALGMTPTEYRQNSHNTAVQQIRDAAQGLFAGNGQGVMDALGEADAGAQQPTEGEALTDAERQFLTFALDLAFDEMVSNDGFTDEDHAALEKFRALATPPAAPAAHEEPQP